VQKRAGALAKGDAGNSRETGSLDTRSGLHNHDANRPTAPTATVETTGGETVAAIIGISGSLRRGSYNTALLRAAAQLMPNGTQLQIKTIRGIPLYDGDLEAADGIPQPVRELKEAVTAADGLLLVTPEYNNSIPGVFKNAIDWLSATCGHPARLRRQASRADRGFTGRIWHHPSQNDVAFCSAQARCRVLIGGGSSSPVPRVSSMNLGACAHA